jgi:hypothetical protein
LSAALLTAGAAQAAISPSLGQAETFGILSSTYTNTTPGTTINGDLGYTTGPATPPTLNGTTHVADATFTQAGTDQGVALSALASQDCTFEFEPGGVDLAANAEFPTATYPPGVYCATGALIVGTGGITLQGAGTYIFRTTGALDTVAGSEITLEDGASECDVWWTPIGAATLGANSTFIGTVINDVAITVGSTVTWTGRALSFGGTVTTDVDTISAPSCAVPPDPAPSASLTVTKNVVNDDDGTLDVSDFPLFINGVPVTSGVATTTLTPGAYTVTEIGDADYDAGAWGGDCAADGTIVLADGDSKTCTITNDDTESVGDDDDDDNDDDDDTGGSSRRRSARSTDSTDTTDSVVATTSQANVSGAGSSSPAIGANFGGSVPMLPNAGLGPRSSLPIIAIPLTALGCLLAIAFLRRKKVSPVVNAI